jgi:hypothetical protein
VEILFLSSFGFYLMFVYIFLYFSLRFFKCSFDDIFGHSLCSLSPAYHRRSIRLQSVSNPVYFYHTQFKYIFAKFSADFGLVVFFPMTVLDDTSNIRERASSRFFLPDLFFFFQYSSILGECVFVCMFDELRCVVCAQV